MYIFTYTHYSVCRTYNEMFRQRLNVNVYDFKGFFIIAKQRNILSCARTACRDELFPFTSFIRFNLLRMTSRRPRLYVRLTFLKSRFRFG